VEVKWRVASKFTATLRTFPTESRKLDRYYFSTAFFNRENTPFPTFLVAGSVGFFDFFEFPGCSLHMLVGPSHPEHQQCSVDSNYHSAESSQSKKWFVCQVFKQSLWQLIIVSFADIYISCVSTTHQVSAKGWFIAMVSSTVETANPEAEIKVGLDLLGPIRQK
jgi:hypothetical protein